MVLFGDIRYVPCTYYIRTTLHCFGVISDHGVRRATCDVAKLNHWISGFERALKISRITAARLRLEKCKLPVFSPEFNEPHLKQFSFHPTPRTTAAAFSDPNRTFVFTVQLACGWRALSFLFGLSGHFLFFLPFFCSIHLCIHMYIIVIRRLCWP